MSEPSAQFTVNATAADGEVAVAAGSTVNLALASAYGVTSVQWRVLGSHDPDVTNPTIATAGYPVGVTASFTMPATAGDQGFVIECKINGGRDITGRLNSSYRATALIGVDDSGNGVAFAFNETFERGPYGYVPKLNTLTGAGGGGSSNVALSSEDGGTLTIDAGAITVGTAGRYRLTPEASAADDILTTINGGTDGQVIVLSPEATKTIIFDNLADNLHLSRSRDLVLTSSALADSVVVQKRGSNWVQIGCSHNQVYRSITASGTIALADVARERGIIATAASAFDLEIPNNSTVNIPSDAMVPVTNTGAGTLTIQAASGVTLNGTSAGSVDLAQYKACVLWKTASNTWLAIGGIS